MPFLGDEGLDHLYNQCTIETLIQFEYSAFEEATVPICTLVFNNSYEKGKKGCYFRLTDFRGGMEVQRQKVLEAISNHDCGYYFEQTTDVFTKIPGAPTAYWVSQQIYNAYTNGVHIDITRKGMVTADNPRFVRAWFEIDYGKFNKSCKSREESVQSMKKWFPYAKGGSLRRWYGNQESVVNWEKDGYELLHMQEEGYKVGSTNWNLDFIFSSAIVWTKISSGLFSARFIPDGFLFDDASPFCTMLDKEKNIYILGFLNSKVCQVLLDIMNPTLNYSPGTVYNLPILFDQMETIEEKVSNCLVVSQQDWDSYETSWDFQRHPLLPHLSMESESTCTRLSDCFDHWERECQERFDLLKDNEEELNRIFIEIYGLRDELLPDIADKDVTVRKADLERDIRSLVSYAVGCMFGRYSLDVDGLSFAGDKWDASKYSSFVPDADNCIPITDEEYFADDIVGRFVEFVRTVYGTETLENNLDFIAAALGNKGNTSREVIRNYFLNDFYKDHLKIYQKRPIYWLFDSGKQNGFKALVYMHRWNADTVGNLRIEYLHKMQTVYDHELETCQEMIDHGSGHDVAVASRRKEKLIKQIKECKDYDTLVAHIAFSKISINLDDGVKANYRRVQIGADGKFCEILAASKDIMTKEK